MRPPRSSSTETPRRLSSWRSQAIAKDPKRWEAYDFAGQIAMLLEDYDMAKVMFQKALQNAPPENRPDIQFKLDDLNKRTAK